MPDPPNMPPPRVNPPFQFSLRWLMIAMTIAAVVLFLAVSFAGFFDVLFVSLFWSILPTPLIIIVVYARDDLQAFAIGALVPWATLIAVGFPQGMSSFFWLGIWLLPMSGICGALAAATHRWLLNRGRR